MDRVLQWPVVIAFALALTMLFVLHKTQFGRHVYAIRGNRAAAVRAGIPVDRQMIVLYTLSAATARSGARYHRRKDRDRISSMVPRLSVRNLVKRFGGLTAVNHVSLDVDPGEVVGLVGDNAAGKSTLIKCISGVHQADEGEIVFLGQPVDFARPMDSRNAGIETIYQDLALAGNLGISANIFLGREAKKKYLGGIVRTLDETFMSAASRQVLNKLNIRFANLEENIEKLSGGQRQAVAIARAMYWQARLMIMDEPTNNLGVVEQRKVLDLIVRLREEQVPVILISHTLPDIFAITDRIVVMHRGRRVAEKRTAETNSQEIVQYMMGALNDAPTD
jgi:ABC-type sugar transport system ATPase subunit